MKHDDNGDLILPPGQRSEYDDDPPVPVPPKPVPVGLPPRKGPQVPAVNSEADALIAFVNKLPWERAWLPADYAVLNKVVAGIEDIDKLAAIANKTDAMASYEHARRENEIAAKNLKRAVTRIWLRMGELYKQSVAPAGRPGKYGPAGPNSGAIKKGKGIGHSPKQVKTAMAMASAPPDVIDRALRADPPVSKTALAKEGRKARAATKPPVAYPPSDPRSDENKAATKLLHAASALAKIDHKLALVPGALEPDEIKAVLSDCSKIEKVIARVRFALETCPDGKAS